MNAAVRAAALRFGIFVLVCLLGTFALLAVFSEFRFAEEVTYRADFTDVSGLKTGDFVRIAGVEVGKVKSIGIADNTTAVVEFSTDPTVTLTESSKAAVRWENPIGDRYLALLDGGGDRRPLKPGDTIAVSNTQPALDLDTLLGGFRPLFRALDPEQVNRLSAQLIAAFQDEGATIGSFLTETASVTSTLADRDALIGQVITNLSAVMSTLSGQSDQFAKAVDSLSLLTEGLAARRTDVSNAVAYTNAAAATLADLLGQGRAPLNDALTETGRVSGNIAADREWFDNFLETVPHSYKVLSRLGIMGDFFTFYLCDLVLKVNGKGGQPVYVKLAGQDSGRCGPK